MVRAPYRTALRLLVVAADHWALLEAHYYQVDLLSLSIRKLLNLVYAWVIRGAKPEEVERVNHELAAPLPGETKPVVTHSDLADDAAAFLALHQGKG